MLALLCFALLCFALLCFALLCFACLLACLLFLVPAWMGARPARVLDQNTRPRDPMARCVFVLSGQIASPERQRVGFGEKGLDMYTPQITASSLGTTGSPKGPFWSLCSDSLFRVGGISLPLIGGLTWRDLNLNARCLSRWGPPSLQTGKQLMISGHIPSDHWVTKSSISGSARELPCWKGDLKD